LAQMAGESLSDAVQCRNTAFYVTRRFCHQGCRRTAHNPVNSELLDHMDRVGMLGEGRSELQRSSGGFPRVPTLSCLLCAFPTPHHAPFSVWSEVRHAFSRPRAFQLHPFVLCHLLLTVIQATVVSAAPFCAVIRCRTATFSGRSLRAPAHPLRQTAS
jgi:hypothetical protein